MTVFGTVPPEAHGVLPAPRHALPETVGKCVRILGAAFHKEARSAMTSNISRALVGTAATTLLALGPLAGLAAASDDDYSCGGNDNDGYVEEYADYFGSTGNEGYCED